MNFYELHKKLSTRLKKIARRHNRYSFFIDEYDLYQEMCVYLWNKYGEGMPAGVNEAYVVRGCEFHILNYLRLHRDKVSLISIEQPINENGDTIKEILPDQGEPLFKDTFKYGEFIPAFAVGIYDAGTERDKTNNNLVYFKTAKTIKVKDFSLGRFSVGYFWGNKNLLLDADGNKDANGILAAWERTMSEISDKLWLCVEYEGSKSTYGALNLEFSWKFTPSTSVLIGYEFYNDRKFPETTTIQVDVDF